MLDFVRFLSWSSWLYYFASGRVVWWFRWSVQEGGDRWQSQLLAANTWWRRTSWYAG